MLKPALTFLAALFCVIAMPSAANADTPISAVKAPGIVAPAGKHVIYYDRTRLFVLDPRAPGDPEWLAIQAPSETSYDGRIICSSDGEGTCVVGLRKDDRKLLGVFDAPSRSWIITSIELDRILAVASTDQVYIARTETDGAQHVLRVRTRTQEVALIGVLRAGETFDLLPIGTSLEPVFVVGANAVRFPGQPISVPVKGGLSSGRSTSPRYVFGANGLFTKYPDGLDRAVIWRRSYSRDMSGKLGGPFDIAEFLLPDPSLPLTESFKTDQRGHVLGLKASGDNLRLEALCTTKGEGGHDVKDTKLLTTLPMLAEVRVIGDGLGEGFVVRVRRPGEKEVFDYVSFEQSAPDRLGGTACSDLDAEIVENLPIPGSTFPTGWVEEVREFATSGGTKIQGVLFRQAEDPITTLIVDVYGASGLLRTTLGAPNDFLQSEKMKGVAIFYPVLPGDGNLGWHFAESARSPNRTETVRMLADVVKQARSQLLTRGGKLILRGGSAGGWLAVKTALSEPNLADEVVAISGAYFFEDSDDVIRLADFFTASDSLTEQEVAGCGKTFFRLIHGTDDQVTPLERTKRFAGIMSANNCEGALHLVVGGDHHLIDFWDLRINPETNNILHWEHGLEP